MIRLFKEPVFYVGGSIIVAVIVLYFGFAVPKIKECHSKGGVIVRVDGHDKCVEPPKEIK